MHKELWDGLLVSDDTEAFVWVASSANKSVRSSKFSGDNVLEQLLPYLRVCFKHEVFIYLFVCLCVCSPEFFTYSICVREKGLRIINTKHDH